MSEDVRSAPWWDFELVSGLGDSGPGLPPAQLRERERMEPVVMVAALKGVTPATVRSAGGMTCRLGLIGLRLI